MKPVKILKRPAASPTPPANPTERVASEVAAMMEACLNRERTRLEAMYRARQDALLRSLSGILNEGMERMIATAAKRELDSLMEAFLKLTSNNPETAIYPTVDNDLASATREAFALTFEKVLLPRFEQSIADLLKSVVETVETQVDTRLVKPSTEVASTLERAADSLRSVRTDISEMRTNDSEATILTQVQAALDDGDVVGALRLSVDKSEEVRIKAVNGLLGSDVKPQDTFSKGVPPITDLVKFASLLTNDLADRTEQRLQWLYEIIMSLDDTEDPLADIKESEVGKYRMLLEEMISHLNNFQTSGSPSPQETKDAKLLNRVLKTHLNVLPS